MDEDEARAPILSKHMHKGTQRIARTKPSTRRLLARRLRLRFTQYSGIAQPQRSKRLLLESPNLAALRCVIIRA